MTIIDSSIWVATTHGLPASRHLKRGTPTSGVWHALRRALPSTTRMRRCMRMRWCIRLCAAHVAAYVTVTNGYVAVN